MSLQTMFAAVNNSPQTALAEDITAEATSMTLLDASVLADAPNICVIGTDDSAEIVSYTSIIDNVVSGMVRGINQTIPKIWEADTIVARNMTAYDHEAFRANIIDLDTRKANAADLGALADHDTVNYETEVTGKPSVFPPASHFHDDRYYTESETDNLLEGKSDTSHTHDDRYFTETEINSTLEKYLSSIVAYDAANIDIDTMTFPTALVSLSSSMNVSLYNVFGSGYAYVMQLFYNSQGATRNHLQLAFKYTDTTMIAWRVYNSGWKNWHVVDIDHLHDDRYFTEAEINTKLSGKSDTSHNHDGTYLKLTGGSMSGNVVFNNGKYLQLVPADTTNLKQIVLLIRNNERAAIYQYPQGNTSRTECYLFPAVDTSITGNKYYDILTSRNPVTIAQGGTGAGSADDALANLGAVSKAGDTMSDTLSIKKSIYDASASSISTATDSLFAVKDKNNRYICYTRGRQETDGTTSIDIRARRYNSGNVDNYLMLKVATDGTRSVSVSDTTIWRNALGATSGVWPIAQGGTGASTVVNARKAFFGSNLNTTAKHLIAITSAHADGGYITLPLPIAFGGTGGTDSDWQELTNSGVFTGTIYYRKVGILLYFMSTNLKLVTKLEATKYVQLGTIPSGYRPVKDVIAGCFANTSGVSVRTLSLRITSAGIIYLYGNSDEIQTTYTLLFSGVGASV